MNDFSTSPYLLDEHPLIIQRTLAIAVGLNEAIILQRVHFWIVHNRREQSAKHYHDGRYWTYNTVEEWIQEFPFWSAGTIKRAFSNLEKQGILLKGFWSPRGSDRTKWTTIDYEKYQSVIQSLDQNDPMGSDQDDPAIGSKRSDDLYTERSAGRSDQFFDPGEKKSDTVPDRLAGEENSGLTGEEDLIPREESEISTLVKNQKFEGQIEDQDLALQRKEKSSAKREKKGNAPQQAENTPLSHASDRWVQSTVISIYDANRAKKWRAAGVGEWNAGILSGLEQFLARANGDRVEAYRLLGMSIAAMAKDKFWGDRPLSMNQVLKYDPTASSSNFCGQWLGAAIEAEERRNAKADHESIPSAFDPLSDFR